MKARTEELLYFLLWSAESLVRPTFRNLNESFEGWAYRSGFLRELALLEKRKFLEKHQTSDRIYRLTAEGRLHALGGRDPQMQWSRGWDGRWRLVCFDVSTQQNAQRQRLRRYLRNRGFGYLQNSVWITPDDLSEQMQLVGSTQTNVESLILFEGKACGGESDADIVSGAWDFERINKLYRRYLEILNSRPSQGLTNKTDNRALRSWAEAERIAWRVVLEADPLLPEQLLPAKYLGRRAWHRRIQVLAAARRSLDSFRS